MTDLTDIAPAFIDIAHRIVWATVATVDRHSRPRSRVLHPIWEWEDGTLSGWVGTGPTPVKVADLEHSPYVSVSYWDSQHDIATAECRATWHHDDDTCRRIWDAYVAAPPPLGYDPSIIPAWSDPTRPEFAVLEFTPWRLRVFPGSALLGEGEVLNWRAAAADDQPM
ncbi:pyridoxamine 5'-phosphate oxidase family protein [Euzebya tangerina]|uniref:pyridoxamine 5'-phosphate oxidase family protein n=1 Tax=Euzebya tangerina TaxID=591198 RepID=UPI000E31BE48|nr:pyridoxamine 5'-phosphate oxidase family protein [Euzebya tangerina]